MSHERTDTNAAATVVTLSASYGAGGSVVGPRVAELLGTPFLDRAIPTEVSSRLAVPLDEVLVHDDRAAHGVGALMASFARIPMFVGGGVVSTIADERAFREEAERVIRSLARQGGVILGRAAALVLADHPGALHVRLDAPADARVAQAVRLSGLAEDDARREQRDADRARDAYVKHFYGADPADPRLYHLVLDSTALDLETCAELVATAAQARRPAAEERFSHESGEPARSAAPPPG
jgi:cytidylate kinase